MRPGKGEVFVEKMVTSYQYMSECMHRMGCSGWKDGYENENGLKMKAEEDDVLAAGHAAFSIRKALDISGGCPL